MFTGLVREVGRVAAVRHRGAVTILDVAAPRTATGLAIGDSLAVDGICLTVTRIAGDRVQVEATVETRRVTTLARWRPGRPVHLEPSLRAGESIGGHFVLGHVDGVGRLVSLARQGGSALMTVALDRQLAGLLVPKGSIAVDGVSLTLDEGPFAGRFAVTLIPHTLAATHLGSLRQGDEVNLEVDVLTKAARAPASGPSSRDARPSPAALTLASLLARGWQGGGRRDTGGGR